MKIVGTPGTTDLLQLHEQGLTRCTEFCASIPYASNGVASAELFDSLEQSKKKAEIYFRIDWSVPFNPVIIRRYISTNIVFRGIPNYLHAKVFWWKGWGAYIGSNNLTDRACFENFEAGVFIDDSEINKIETENLLSLFFQDLKVASAECSEKILGLMDQQKKYIEAHLQARATLEQQFSDRLDSL